MRNYRTEFLLALAGNAVLAAALFVFWKMHRQPAPPAAPAVAATGTAAGAQPLAGAAPAGPPLAPIQLGPRRTQSINLQTGAVQLKDLSDDIRTVGNVAVDEQLQSSVQLRFPGWVQKTFANTTWQYVRRGQPLLTIYSPQLVTTEQEYLLAVRNARQLRHSTVEGVASGAAALVEAARQRLQQWQVPPAEIARLQRTGTVSQTIPVVAPASGFIAQRNVLPNQYVQPETPLYTIADLSRVWVNAQIFQNDIGRVRPGDAAMVRVDAYPGVMFRGRVDFIWPQVDEATRTVKVRLVFPNSGLRLKPGMFVNVDLKLPMGRQLAIPASGVLQSGARQIVFIDQGGGNLQPREVELGPQVGDNYVVLKGLKAGDRIVTSANFLIDSESQLQAAAGAFEPQTPAAAPPAANAPATTIDLTSTPDPPVMGENVFRVHLARNGQPVTGAQVTAVFYMAAMPAMGMAAIRTQVNFSEQGGGNYSGQGKLGSAGAWQVTITAVQNGQTIAAKHSR